MRLQYDCFRRLSACVAACALLATQVPAFAAINWDGQSGTNWWFDPVNWNPHAPGAVAPYFVPPTTNGLTVTDTNLNIGWNLAGEGVVFDPDNDPFFAALDPNDYDYADEAGLDGVFDRDTIWRFYLTTSGASVNNKLTIKSGSLEVINGTGTSNVQIGRGGAIADLTGTVIQTGGSFQVLHDNLDLGNFHTTPGNGVYNYFGGTLEAGLETATDKGIRLAAGGSSGSAKSGYLGIHNGGAPGHIRAWNFVVGAHIETTFGTTNSVATVEFFADENGTRPVQVLNNLSINNQDDSGVSGSKRSAVLKLSLDAPPTLDPNGRPDDMGLFDVGNILGGQSAIFFDDSIDNGGNPYSEGSLISADFLGSTYTWSISYTGDIEWDNLNNGDPGLISGAGNGNDIVLMGHSSNVVGTPGDFDGDGDVDGIDFLKWQRGETPGNGSGTELNDWANNYNTGGLSAVTAVPEPASGVLAVTFACLFWGVRSRRPQ